MSQFRILDTNYFFSSSYTMTVSSEDADFPKENLRNYLRSKVWRTTPGSNYVIDATNNKLDFTEGGGELTATISSGTYTATTLCTEIDTRVTAAGAGSYTVTYSTTTGKFTIVKSAGTFTLKWATGTNTATSIRTAIGFSNADDTGALTYTSDTVALHTEEWVKLDLGSAKNVDSVAVIFDGVDGVRLSASAVVKIQGNATDAWTAPSVDTTLSLDASYDVMTHFYSSAQSYRWWRLKIVDVDNSNLFVEIPKVVLSSATQLGQVPEVGFRNKIVDGSKKAENEYGHSYFDIYPSRRYLRFMFKALSSADIETMFLMFQTVGKHTPVCVSLDSTATLFDKDRFFLYGRFTTDFDAQHEFYDRFNLEMEIAEGM